MDANNYDRVNKLQMRDGKQLIERIKKDYGNRQIECILDIGCGSGNLTVLLNKYLNVKRIIAVDVDQNMIGFAKQNNNQNNNIQYLNQDLGLVWNELGTQLKENEGKVSLIFTNYCLHWIYTNKENLVKNLFKLLAKKGKIYSLIAFMPHPADKITSKVVSYIVGKLVAIPSKGTQEEEWTKSFKEGGFEIIDFNNITSVCRYEVKEFDEYITPLACQMYRQFSGSYLINIFKLMMNAFGAKASSSFPQFKDESTGQMMCETHFQMFVYILSKK